MLFKVELENDVAVVILAGNALEDSNIRLIDDQLGRLVEKHGQHEIHLSFRNLKVLTSVGLGKLVSLHKKIRARGGNLSLHHVNSLLYEVFEVTRLTTLLDIRRDGPEVGAA